MAILTGAARQHLIDNSGQVPKTAYKATIWVFFILAVLSTLARCVIRVFTRRRPGLDDFFVVLATAALAVTWGVLLKQLNSLYITEALNDHPTEFQITLDELPDLLAVSKWSKIMVAMGWLSIFAIKGAFLCFFSVLIRQLSRGINIYFWVVVVFNVGSWLTLSFIDWAICPYVGEKTIQCEVHFNYNTSLAVNTVSPVFDIICDIMIVSIPILVLSRSLMSTWQKISYSGILCLSVVMIIMALIRLVGSVVTTHKTNRGTAPIWGTFWEMLEACLAVIMACFLTFRSVFVKGGGSNHAGTPALPNNQFQRPGSFWERLLSTLRFRSRYRKSPSVTAEEGHVGVHDGNGNVSAEGREKNYVISTANMTRPTLAFSRLRTLFGSVGGTQGASDTGLLSRGTIDVVTEFDLRELDYHQVLRDETRAPPSAGVGSTQTGGRRGDGVSFRSS
ncbi:hypothetical protein VMCG_05887 [Cytospora schulzeri]|uniref:Rhodopsin domain-containing protein n=1 Tax=Cytospora schulzeri TaxID=448051 RepID=A0A423WDA4_9PEZI|nr:hypothetical protein VMCG_05887 [Valsa malicola]